MEPAVLKKLNDPRDPTYRVGECEGQARTVWAPDGERKLGRVYWKAGKWHESVPRKPGDPVIYPAVVGMALNETFIEGATNA